MVFVGSCEDVCSLDCLREVAENVVDDKQCFLSQRRASGVYEGSVLDDRIGELWDEGLTSPQTANCLVRSFLLISLRDDGWDIAASCAMAMN